MWRDVASVVAHVSAEDAAAELRAQVEHALACGIDVTHLDTHMGTVMQPQYLPPYVDLAIEFRLPIFFIRPSERRLAALGDGARVYMEQTAKLEAHGWPLLDNIIAQTLSEIEPEDKDRRFREMFATLRPGLTHFLVPPGEGRRGAGRHDARSTAATARRSTSSSARPPCASTPRASASSSPATARSATGCGRRKSFGGQLTAIGLREPNTENR